MSSNRVDLPANLLRATAYLTHEQQRALEHLAQQRQMRPGAVIRDAVRFYLASPEIRAALREVAA